MVRALRRKNLWPAIRIPSAVEARELLAFTGPLLAITITRLAGFLAMQKAAMKLGVQSLAAYQLSINVLFFFLLFGEPLSQVAQTKLPPLLDANDGNGILSTFRSVVSLGGMVAVGIGILASAFLALGTPLFTSDLPVQSLARQTSLSAFAAVTATIFAIAVDGAFLAAKDFGYMLGVGLLSTFLQIALLRKYATSINFILGTFTLRLGSYALLSLLRVRLGFGPLGKAIRKART